MALRSHKTAILRRWARCLLSTPRCFSRLSGPSSEDFLMRGPGARSASSVQTTSPFCLKQSTQKTYLSGWVAPAHAHTWKVAASTPGPVPGTTMYSRGRTASSSIVASLRRRQPNNSKRRKRRRNKSNKYKVVRRKLMDLLFRSWGLHRHYLFAKRAQNCNVTAQIHYRRYRAANLCS